MWELDHKESWVLKNWCFWSVVLEKTLESPLDSKAIKAIDLKGNQTWIFTTWTDAEVEAPILWPLDVIRRLIGKDPDAVKDWRQKEEGVALLRWSNGISKSMDLSLSKIWEVVKYSRAWQVAVLGVAKNLTWLSDWTAPLTTLFDNLGNVDLFLKNTVYNSPNMK